MMAAAGFLLTGMAAETWSRVWDDRPSGQEGALARLARVVAAISVQVPVVVVIDDADQLESDLAAVLIENLVSRADGQVLVATPRRLCERPRGCLTPRYRAWYGTADCMNIRACLWQQCPHLPPTVWCGPRFKNALRTCLPLWDGPCSRTGQGLDCGTQRCSPSQDHCGIGKPSGTSAAESW